MCSNIKQGFDREEMLSVCVKYYMDRGYTEEHCYKYVGILPDDELERVFKEICEESSRGFREFP